MRVLLKLAASDPAKFVAEADKLLPQECKVEQHGSSFAEVWQMIADTGKEEDRAARAKEAAGNGEDAAHWPQPRQSLLHGACEHQLLRDLSRPV